MNPHEVLAAIAEVAAEEPPDQLGLYVHVPFCATKCHFCDWVVDVPVSRLRGDAADRRGYVEAVCRQIRFYGPLLTRMGYRPTVMYWGGGTPTRLEPAELDTLAAALRNSFDLSGLSQWSVETTPNDLSPEKLHTLRGAGVNRVSLGIQSLNPYQLRRSGRGHSAEQALAAADMLRAAGIDNFNVDLISSFPGEDLTDFEATLRAVLALEPPHVSVYPYRATPKTVMAMQLDRRTLAAHTAQHMIDAYELAMSALRHAGYHEYCHGYWVREARHEDMDGNYKYDLAGDKIGFGSGAESIIGHHLLWNENNRYREFLAEPLHFTYAERYSLSRPDLLTAPVGGALMTREGVVFERFRKLTGLSFHDARRTPYLARWLQGLQECGATLVEDDTALRLEPSTIHRAYINHLAATASREALRA